MSDNKYAVKNAFLYSILITIVLLAPTYFYVMYTKNVYDIQYEFTLKKQSLLIIKAMEEFDSENQRVFDYPRYQTIHSGLYDKRFNPIFTLIKNQVPIKQPGYYVINGTATLIIVLPSNRYFNADYLVVQGPLSYATIYKDVVLILFSITGLIFLLSLFFLNRFSLPFKRINEKLDRFIKDSMHEINTPLAIINVNIDLHNRINPPSKYLQRVKAATKTLANIYNDMDYLIKNERLLFEYEKINLSHYLKERCEYFSEVAALKNINIESDVADDIWIFFNTTPLQRIIDNNISNALKYSHEGGVVKVILTYNGHECIMSFKDNGIGIEYPEKIFERYYRENKDKGGFGIGLNIVKSIIDKAGIILKIDSVYPGGSTFSYYFPSSMYLLSKK